METLVNDFINFKDKKPILYSFRRCPYAIRARLALYIANIEVIIREIELKNKPKEFLEISPSKTVPCLHLEDHIIDESLDIMTWALSIHDPKKWMQLPEKAGQLIKFNDGPFKTSLDITKYSNRFPKEDIAKHKKICSDFMIKLDGFLKDGYLLSNQATLLDMALLPFVRQFALINKNWFDRQKWPKLIRWLDEFIDSELFLAVQKKYTFWCPNDVKQLFP